MGKRRTFKIEWKMSDRKLSAADVDRLEDLLAVLIARLIVAERAAAAAGDMSKKSEDAVGP